MVLEVSLGIGEDVVTSVTGFVGEGGDVTLGAVEVEELFSMGLGYSGVRPLRWKGGGSDNHIIGSWCREQRSSAEMRSESC
mmetsp:Transcript_25508/g.75152  ORF Transcript_25508/g.75152 Transcript_25508/m.75152 type:complete len:81 (-) Transcript_25508:336-578(-)